MKRIESGLIHKPKEYSGRRWVEFQLTVNLLNPRGQPIDVGLSRLRQWVELVMSRPRALSARGRVQHLYNRLDPRADCINVVNTVIYIHVFTTFLRARTPILQGIVTDMYFILYKFLIRT